MKKKKAFDCVEMKRRGAEHVRQATKGMTPEQELAYWRERDMALRREIEQAKARRARDLGKAE